jgi:Tol biopolymer transport system component
MNNGTTFSRIAVLCALILSFGLVLADQQDQPLTNPQNVTETQLGARPAGRIAFISDGGIWAMDTDGKNRQKICAVTNAKGRLSFSPDNKIIAFSREGKDANKLPSDEGGMHLLHDIFLAYVDSASVNTNWWKRVTFGLGGFFPEWSGNDTIIYYQNDINANFVDYIIPSHQMAKVNITDGNASHLRKDWQTLNTSIIMPSFSRDGQKVAFVLSYADNPEQYSVTKHGIKIMNRSDMMMPESDLRKSTKGLNNAVAPSWSPDGQWLAYVSNDMRNPGIFIIRPDLSQKRLVFAPSLTQQISPNPVGWSPSSEWMTFATMDGTIYVIDINGERLTPITGAGMHSNPTWSQ